MFRNLIKMGINNMSINHSLFDAAGCISADENPGRTDGKMFPERNRISYRTDAPELRFPVIISIYENDDRDLSMTTNLIRHIYDTADLREFAVCFPLNPQGEDPYVKPAVFAERFARLKTKITNPDIKLGVLLQQTIGHGAKWNANASKTLPWQRTVNVVGNPSVRFCPLDKNFKDYIRKSVAEIFAFKPEFVIYDDDMRLSLGPVSRYECFCPLHVDYFNQKYGTNYSAEQLKTAMINAPGGAELLKQFTQARYETLADFLAMIRTELDKYNPDARGILCTAGNNIEEMARIAKVGAGKNISAIRIGNGYYLEAQVCGIVARNVNTGIQVASNHDQVDEMLDESDTCPHNLFSKSARTMHLHIVSGLLHGLDGGKLWIANLRYYDLQNLARYSQIIGKNQGFYRELHRTLKGVRWQGGLLSVPAPESDPHPEYPGGFFRTDSWIKRMTGYFGLPHRYEKFQAKGIHLLCGDQISYFTDSELRQFLADGAILDAAAAVKLEERGLSLLTGVKVVPVGQKIAAGEWMHGMNYPIGAFGAEQYELRPADKENMPQYLSEFRDRAFTYSVETAHVCNGAALFKNALGGKVVTVPFVIQDSRIGIVPERQNYMRKIFDLLDILPAWSVEPFDVYFRFGTLENGKQDITAVCNISYEMMPEVLIGVKRVPSKIEKLASDGGWDECGFSVRDNTISINDALMCADTGIYKFSY